MTKKPVVDLETAIRRALARELTKMQLDKLYPGKDRPSHIDAGWSGPALASWIAAGVIRSVEAALAGTT